MLTLRIGSASVFRRRLLARVGLVALAAIGLATAVAAQTTPLTTTTNQSSQVNSAATWTHPYWGVETLCSDPACNPVIPALNPNQNSPLGSIYDYYAYSPPVTKFVDPLPTVPIAVPDQQKYPGSDYYELSVEDYRYSFHRDMGLAVLRGYQQTNDTSGSQYSYTDSSGAAHQWPLTQLHHYKAGYAGPQIVNVRNTPTRVKMTNNKSITGSGPHTYPDGLSGPSGLQIPVDETMPGAGSGPPLHLTTGNASFHATAGSYVNNGAAGGVIYHTQSGVLTSVHAAAGGPIGPFVRANVTLTSVHLAAGGPLSFVAANTRLQSVHAAAGGPVTYVTGTQTLNSVHATANPNGVSYVTAALPSVHPTANASGVSYVTSDLPSVHAAGGGPVSYVTNTKTVGGRTYQQFASCSSAMQAIAGLCTTVPAWTAYTTCSPVPGRVTCTAIAQYATCNTAEIGAGVCTTVPAWTAYSACSPVPGRITCTAVAQYATCNAAELSAGVCTTVPAWAQYSACTPAGSAITCSNVTFNANATCTAAEQAVGVQCTTVPAWAQYSPCTAVPGQVTCSNPVVTAGTTCTSTLQAVPGLCTTIPAWTTYSACTPVTGQVTCGSVSFAANATCTADMTATPAIGCTTVPAWTQYSACQAIGGITCANIAFTANTACDPSMVGVAGFFCKSLTWTALSPCTPIGSIVSCTTSTWAINDTCTAPQSTVAGFACTNASWTAGDYCSITQVDNKNYSCTAGDYSFDRALLHQHGGNTPWISDGTPHQWTTPVNDTTSPYKRGLSNFNIPDMDCAFDTATNTTPSGCDGVNTYFYTNQNSARMMWYHDHSYGITRTNVYNGELSLYFTTDAIEQAMLGGQSTGNGSIDNVFKAVGLSTDTQTPAAGAIPTFQPDNRFGNTLGTTLNIQDKTFVWGYDGNANFGFNSAAAQGASLANPITTQFKDSLWSSACGKHPASSTDGNTLATFASGSNALGPFGSKDPCPTDTGSLWFPHVYSSNTDPNTGATVSGGRWDFGPWVYPAATIYSQYLPTVSAVPESFLDTIVTNGKAYPYMNVPRKPMRFRVINASNERYLNLQLYYAVNNSGAASGVTSTGTANPFAFNVDPSTVCNNGGNTDDAAALGTAGLTTHNYANCTEVGMILQNGSQKTGAYLVPIPAYIKPPAPCGASPVDCAANADGSPYSGKPGKDTVYIPVNTGTWQHFGGVPDPTYQVPFIQIGNEGGFMPSPIVHYNQTAEIETDPRNITLSNVRNNPVANPPTCPGCVLPYPGYTLAMGPAERADIIIDFGSVPDGATLILYNDMIAPNPGYDQRYDVFTADSDMTAINGPRQTQQGQGPNTRTIMQFRVDGTINFPGATPATDPTSGRTTYSEPLPANWVEEINPYGSVYNANDARPTTSTAPLNAALAAAFTASHVDPMVSASVATTTAPRTSPDGQRSYQDGTPYFMGAVDPPAYMDLTKAAVGKSVAGACDGSDPNLAGCPTSRLCTYGDTALCTGGLTEFPTCAINSKNSLSGKIDNSKDPNYRKSCGFPVFTKAIAEDFDPPSGRLNAMLGNETTSIEANGQQTYGFPFVEPITERLHEGETQVWQVIHNGIDTHTIHFHLMNVQVIGRIDWAGIPKLPDAEERGWKEVVKFQPLETTVIAVRMNRPGQNYDHPANNPAIPFTVPTSYRVSDVTSAIGETDPAANAQGQQLLLPFLDYGNGLTTYANAVEDFSWEYVWHCHLLGHEEADMMRPQVMQLDNNGVAGQPAVPEPAGIRLGIQ